jgi:hypothetical protein
MSSTRFHAGVASRLHEEKILSRLASARSAGLIGASTDLRSMR